MMRIELKLRNEKKETIEFENVKEWFLENGFLVVGYKINKAVKFEPIRLEDIDYWEEIGK